MRTKWLATLLLTLATGWAWAANTISVNPATKTGTWSETWASRTLVDVTITKTTGAVWSETSAWVLSICAGTTVLATTEDTNSTALTLSVDKKTLSGKISLNTTELVTDRMDNLTGNSATYRMFLTTKDQKETLLAQDVVVWRTAYYYGMEPPAGISGTAVTGPSTHGASYVPQWVASTTTVAIETGFPITTAGKAILDDADAAAQRTTLGLGTAATAAAGDFASASHAHAASAITSGTLDGDRLPALSTTKRGGVPATGTPSGKYLKDDGTWSTVSAGVGDMTKAVYDTNSNNVVDNAAALAGITPGAGGLLLLDDADVAAIWTTLGLGTAAGSAIGDFATAGHNHNGVYALVSHAAPWSTVTETPTTLAGYGVSSVPWSYMTETPTTLAGYGITDAAAIAHNHAGESIVSGTISAARLPDLSGTYLTATTVLPIIPGPPVAFSIDGGGSAVAAGWYWSGPCVATADGYLSNWTMRAGDSSTPESGTASLEIYRATDAQWPAGESVLCLSATMTASSIATGTMSATGETVVTSGTSYFVRVVSATQKALHMNMPTTRR